MNFLDILITPPQHVYKKSTGQDRRICSLILGVKGLKTWLHLVINPALGVKLITIRKISLRWTPPGKRKRGRQPVKNRHGGDSRLGFNLGQGATCCQGQDQMKSKLHSFTSYQGLRVLSIEALVFGNRMEHSSLYLIACEQAPKWGSIGRRQNSSQPIFLFALYPT